MLPDQLGALLSAYVDGELSPKQTSAVRRLLKHSEDARRLLSEFQANAVKLRALPCIKLPQDFSETICARLPARPTVPIPVTRAAGGGVEPRRSFAFRWAGFSAAAGLFL